MTDEQNDAPAPAGLFLGTAGWAYRDWDGVVYPQTKPRGWHALDFLSCYFNLCEINTSFYRIPSPRTSQSWTRRIAGHPDFLFTAKLWQGFTHSKTVDLPHGWLAQPDVDAFRAFLDPMVEAGRFGCLLVQFPWSFRPSPENHERLERIAEAFADYPLAVEIRHQDWDREPFLRWLRERRIAFTNIDQPVFGGSIPPTEHVTSEFYYVRFHGRNRENWFAEKESGDERYDYLYTREELFPWVERIERMRVKSQRGFVVTNNHFRGQGMANALQLSVDLKRPIPPPPESLARAFPAVRTLGSPGETRPPHTAGPEQLELF
jgi:uncharacterized protein YecE (DUF72 family)